MPAFATHYIFFEELEDFLKENSDFEFNKEAAAIGSQGPDIFFFCRILPFSMPGKPLAKIGSLLHRAKPSDILDAFCEYLEISSNIDIAKSYIYGFILHYALDRKCHPFVYSVQEKIVEHNKFIHPSSAHNKVEYSLDSLMLNNRLGIYPPNEIKLYETFGESKEVVDEISRLLSFTISKAINKSISENDISKAVSDTNKMQKLFQDESGFWLFVAKTLETISAPISKHYKFSVMFRTKDLEKAKKYANINGKIWTSPFDSSKHNESFEELFENAKDDAKKLIIGFNDMLKGETDGKTITDNLSFLTGLEVD